MVYELKLSSAASKGRISVGTCNVILTNFLNICWHRIADHVSQLKLPQKCNYCLQIFSQTKVKASVTLDWEEQNKSSPLSSPVSTRYSHGPHWHSQIQIHTQTPMPDVPPCAHNTPLTNYLVYQAPSITIAIITVRASKNEEQRCIVSESTFNRLLTPSSLLLPWLRKPLVK